MKDLSVRNIARRVGLRRQRVLSARVFVERHWIARSKSPLPARPRILCYHSIEQSEMGVNDVSRERFVEHLDVAASLGYGFVPAADIASGVASGKVLAITFDDALRSVADHAAPVLVSRQIPYSVFAVTSWCDRTEDWQRSRFMSWDDLAAIADEGCDVGSHSVTHPRFTELGRDAMLEELQHSREVLNDRLGFAPAAFAIPFGQSGDWNQSATDLASSVGYEFLYAQAESTRPKDTIPRTFVTQHDSARVFRAALEGAFDAWEEPV